MQTFNCIVCGKEFTRLPYKIRLGHTKYCSNHCSAMVNGYKKNFTPWSKGEKFSEEHRKNIGLAKVGHTPWNKGIKTGPNPKSSLTKKGKPAWNKHKACPQFQKENNPQWRGGVSKLASMIRKGNKYLEWRKAVFISTDYTCTCGKRGGNLEAHHKDRFHDLLRTYNIKTFHEATNCKELWIVSNGETLCKKCHKARHAERYVSTITLND